MECFHAKKITAFACAPRPERRSLFSRGLTGGIRFEFRRGREFHKRRGNEAKVRFSASARALLKECLEAFSALFGARALPWSGRSKPLSARSSCGGIPVGPAPSVSEL